MEYVHQFMKLCQVETRKLYMFMGIIAISVLMFQTFTLPNRNGFTNLFSHSKVLLHEESSFNTSPKYTVVGNVSVLDGSELINSSEVLEVVKLDEVSYIGEELDYDIETEGNRDLKNDFASEEEHKPDNVGPLEKDSNPIGDSPLKNVSDLDKNSLKETVKVADINSAIERRSKPEKGFSKRGGKLRDFSKDAKLVRLQSGSATLNNSVIPDNPAIKMMRCNMPPKTVMPISEMNSLMLRRRASGIVKPQPSSVRDQELISLRLQIQNASIARNDPELYAPLFRNLSMFKRSYELMERTLKVYVYREGKKPIFHQPILKGIYASEGWFMKLMEGNKKFIVKDPRKAHLFYMPFSTRMLEHSLYVRNSHNRTNLAVYLRNYTNMIAAKYPYWNRTSGTDHFFVACHDWAPYETRHHMERCIKSLCNADVTAGYKIGKDVSLPETYVRSARNPLRDVGGEPPSNRSILAFFAGNMHGYLRPILLSHWKNKDPDMKIFGPMPPGVASKMNYIQHMKTSKYCICAKGFNVNSPRVVEAIFYECVPVIISDNFVPPFFEVLDWAAFSVIVAEKDIPNLKDILISIPYKKYLAMQLAVKKVQRHFLWHSNPVKYDLFHMTLHSIWNNRVFMIKPK